MARATLNKPRGPTHLDLITPAYAGFISYKNNPERGYFSNWRQVRVGITWRQFALRPTLSGKRDPPHKIRAIRWTKGLVCV